MVVIHGTNFNVTGNVLNCDQLTFGAHVYPNGSKGVQSDSNPAIWKAMVAH
jgi:hypothetical protein